MKLADLLVKIGADTREFRRGLSDADVALERIGSRMQGVGRRMSLGLSLPLAAIGGLTVRTAATFESSMNRVGAISGATATQFKALQGQAKELGRTTQYTASQAADAMSFLAMAGFKTDQIMGAMPSTLQLAAAAQMDLARAADITSNILTGYGLSVAELGRANDVLVKAFTSTNTDLSQLGEAFKYAGPVAKGAGVAFEEAAAALGMMGNAGIQGSMAGTALRGALTRLLKPTGEVTATLKRLGVNVKQANGDIRPLVEIVGDLERRGATTADMMALFGQRAGPAMAALVDQGSAALRKLTGELETAGGTAQRIAEAQMKGLSGAWKEFKSAVEGLALATADDGALSWMASLVRSLAGMTRALADVNPVALKFAAGLGALVAIAGPTLVALGALAKAVVALKAAAALGGLAAMVTPAGLLIIGLTALAAAFLAIKGNAKGAAEAVADFKTKIGTMGKAELEAQKKALAEQTRGIEAEIARYQSALEKAEKAGAKTLAKNYERRIENARARLKLVKDAGMEVVQQLRTVEAAAAGVVEEPIEPVGGASTLEEMAKRAKTLGTLYEELKARGADITPVLREMSALHTRIEAAIRRQGGALSDARAEAMKLASELANVVKLEGLKPQIAGAPRETPQFDNKTGRIVGGTRLVESAYGLGRFAAHTVSVPTPAAPAGPKVGQAFASSFMGGLQGPQGSGLGMRDRAMLTLMQGAEKAGAALRNLPQSIGSVGMKLLGVFNPLSIVGSMLNGAFEALAPTLEVLQEPIRVVGEIFAKALAPILKALWPVFKLVAIAATWIGEIFFRVAAAILNAVGSMVRGLGNLLRKIPGVRGLGKDLQKAGDALKATAAGFKEGADELKKGRDEIRNMELGAGKVADDAEKASEKILNLPDTMRVHLARYRATYGTAVPPSGPAVRSSAPAAVQDNSVHLEGVQIVAAPGEDAMDLWRRLKRVIADEAISRGRPVPALVVP